jgi:hypothetical protein
VIGAKGFTSTPVGATGSDGATGTARFVAGAGFADEGGTAEAGARAAGCTGAAALAGAEAPAGGFACKTVGRAKTSWGVNRDPPPSFTGTIMPLALTLTTETGRSSGPEKVIFRLPSSSNSTSLTESSS